LIQKSKTTAKLLINTISEERSTKNFDETVSPAYVDQNDKIGYVQLDRVSFNTIYGYSLLICMPTYNGKVNWTTLELLYALK
jgi:hypothetical protein